MDSKRKKDAENVDSAHKEERKDAFAIAVLKHSGDIQQTVFHWRNPDDPKDTRLTTTLCENVMQPIIAEDFSPKFLMLLHKEFQRLVQPDKSMPLADIVEPEARRLIKRACEMPDTSAKDKAVEDLTTAVMDVYARSKENFENFVSALDIFDFFIRKDTT